MIKKKEIILFDYSKSQQDIILDDIEKSLLRLGIILLIIYNYVIWFVL